MIHIYTGRGKGKTTASFGLALRAIGWGKKVYIFQFLKGKEIFGEVKTIKKFGRNVEIKKFNQVHPLFLAKDKRKAVISNLTLSMTSAFRYIKNKLKNKEFDLIILDEVLNCISEGFITENKLLNLIKSIPKTKEIILTGRKASKRLIAIADYVTFMEEIKHPYRDKGQIGRKGIEF